MRAASDSSVAIGLTSTQGDSIRQCENRTIPVPRGGQFFVSLGTASHVVGEFSLKKGSGVRPEPEPGAAGDAHAVRGFVYGQTGEEPQFGKLGCMPVFTFQF